MHSQNISGTSSSLACQHGSKWRTARLNLHLHSYNSHVGKVWYNSQQIIIFCKKKVMINVWTNALSIVLLGIWNCSTHDRSNGILRPFFMNSPHGRGDRPGYPPGMHAISRLHCTSVARPLIVTCLSAKPAGWCLCPWRNAISRTQLSLIIQVFQSGVLLTWPNPGWPCASVPLCCRLPCPFPCVIYKNTNHKALLQGPAVKGSATQVAKADI